jgi:ribosomal protein S18 acetylase RimI-like enzyme
VEIMVIIEKARLDDFEQIIALARPEQRSLIGRAMGQSRVSVARVDGAVRGFVAIDDRFYGHGFVELLVVHPDFRRRGLATALMRAAELDAPTEKLFTSTNQSNVPMQRLCERIGFVRSGIIENLDEGDPELVYFKRLAPGRAKANDEYSE